jgi:hypothetical protein
MAEILGYVLEGVGGTKWEPRGGWFVCAYTYACGVNSGAEEWREMK